MDNKIEELRIAANDESLSTEQRTEATRLLADLEKPATLPAMLEQCFAGIDAKAAAYRADQLARFKVCSVCYLKQVRENATCELCGAAKWESPVPASLERGRCIAATTSYTDAELTYHIEHDSISTAFAKHCANVLELRGVPRVRSYWERAGFTFDGRPRA